MAISKSLYIRHKSRVMQNKKLVNGAKLLYFEIVAMSKKTGYCYANNKFLSDKFGIDKRSIQRYLSQLEAEGIIRIDHFVCEVTKRNLRWIWPIFSKKTNDSPVMGDDDKAVMQSNKIEDSL